MKPSILKFLIVIITYVLIILSEYSTKISKDFGKLIYFLWLFIIILFTYRVRNKHIKDFILLIIIAPLLRLIYLMTNFYFFVAVTVVYVFLTKKTWKYEILNKKIKTLDCFGVLIFLIFAYIQKTRVFYFHINLDFLVIIFILSCVFLFAFYYHAIYQEKISRIFKKKVTIIVCSLLFPFFIIIHNLKLALFLIVFFAFSVIFYYRTRNLILLMLCYLSYTIMLKA